MTDSPADACRIAPLNRDQSVINIEHPITQEAVNWNMVPAFSRAVRYNGGPLRDYYPALAVWGSPLGLGRSTLQNCFAPLSGRKFRITYEG